MAKIVIWRGVSEIKYSLFQPNNVKIYEICHNYINLRIVFHTMLIFFSEIRKFNLCQVYLLFHALLAVYLG